jgi:hypothetical protein
MDKAYSQKATASLAEHIYKTSKMGAQSISDVLPKVKSNSSKEKEAFIEELTREYSEYEKISSKAEQILTKMSVEPKEESFMARMSAKAGIMMNTMSDPGISHVAGMMMEGLTMGISDTTRRVRQAEEEKCSREVVGLGDELISFQEQSSEKMKKYL